MCVGGGLAGAGWGPGAVSSGCEALGVGWGAGGSCDSACPQSSLSACWRSSSLDWLPLIPAGELATLPAFRCPALPSQPSPTLLPIDLPPTPHPPCPPTPTCPRVDPFDPDSPIKKMGVQKFPPDMFFVLRVVQVRVQPCWQAGALHPHCLLGGRRGCVHL